MHELPDDLLRKLEDYAIVLGAVCAFGVIVVIATIIAPQVGQFIEWADRK